MRILVVDDQPTMRRVIVNMLKRLGYDYCLEAKDGRDAVDSLKAVTVDLVITDWKMPTMDGLELIHALRAEALTERLPILFVTTNGEAAHVRTALQAGADYYLLKPFTMEAFREKIDKIMQLDRRGRPTAGHKWLAISICTLKNAGMVQ